MLPVKYRPQASIAFGSLAAIFRAAGLKSAGLTLLSVNGALRVIARPFWQGAEANTLKSPLNISGVGTNTVFEIGVCRITVPWYPVKKNILFFLMGPPITPPNWLRFRPSFRVAKGSRPLRAK